MQAIAVLVAPLVACLMTGCDPKGDEARRESFKALELSHTGQPLEEQLEHVNRAVELAPNASTYIEQRANLFFGLQRYAESRADYDRAVQLADRPYLRFERADALCALGEVDAALADLDRAIAAQPENTQFYPRRALARLAAGKIAQSREDIDHAIAAASSEARGSYALAAVLLMEGEPAQAIVQLDQVTANSDYSHTGLPRTLRMLAYTAAGDRERAAQEFDRQTLAAAVHWPDIGYEYWLARRGCVNAFIATEGRDLVSKTRAILAEAVAPALPVMPERSSPEAKRSPLFPAPPYLIVGQTDTTVIVDLDRPGIDPKSERLAKLQLLDDRGVRIAERVEVRRKCESICGNNGDEECHVQGEYRFSGPPVAPFAVAFEMSATIQPHLLDRLALSRDTQLERLAQLFSGAARVPVDSETIFSWQQESGSGDWVEQSSWLETTASGSRRSLVETTGIKFADCALAAFGPLTEFSCSDRRSSYLGNRHLGGSNDPTLGSLVRYSAEINGTLAYFVVVDWNSVNYVRIVFRLNGEWYEDGVAEDRTVC